METHNLDFSGLKIKYALIYKNDWYWNGVTHTKKRCYFDEKPELHMDRKCIVTIEHTHIKDQWGMKLPLNSNDFKIKELHGGEHLSYVRCEEGKGEIKD